ncbi:reverse transcriptase [Senna tora]|uniref:Reverse transcriptase n=1 Tax=Senna tora TaxID=362788 RepID=A0A834WCZ6_9FABA|nr:reverse transcriptase [Senna tora]
MGYEIYSDWSSKFGIACWLIWKQRNQYIFNGKNDDAISLNHLIEIHSKEFFQAQKISTAGNNSEIQNVLRNYVWHPPPSDFIKVNVDGSFNATNHVMSCGAWDKEYSKIIIESDSSFVLHLIENVLIEARPLRRLIVGIRDMVSRKWQVKFNHTLIEGNSVANRWFVPLCGFLASWSSFLFS